MLLVLKMAAPVEDAGSPERDDSLKASVVALEDGSADVAVLKKLARLCAQNPAHEPLSPASPGFAVPLTPSPMDGVARPLVTHQTDYWTQDKLFDHLFTALVKFLDPRKVSAMRRRTPNSMQIARVLTYSIRMPKNSSMG